MRQSYLETKAISSKQLHSKWQRRKAIGELGQLRKSKRLELRQLGESREEPMESVSIGGSEHLGYQENL